MTFGSELRLFVIMIILVHVAVVLWFIMRDVDYIADELRSSSTTVPE